MKILAIGPYIGSFEEEIFTFRPYARWLMKAIKWDKVYLSTHLNRMFLYENFIPKNNMIPVYQHLTRDEKNQKGYIHKNLQKKDFKFLLRKFKDEIMKRENCNKKDIELHHLSYSKLTPPYSIYTKLFEVIPRPEVKIPKEHENSIIFIPAKNEKLEKVAYVYKKLKMFYNIVIIGNTDTWFSENNVILNEIDYFENGFKYMIEYISKAKAIITPLGYWTGIVNLQNKPVFSWGEFPSLYREGGIYNFKNKKCDVMVSSKETHPEIIFKGVVEFLKNLKE